MTRELRAALLGLSAYKALREEPLLKAVGNLLDGLAVWATGCWRCCATGRPPIPGR